MATLGPYTLGEPLTRLALGEVVAASRAARAEPLALLLIDDQFAADYRFRGLLRLEAARAGGVRHPAIARTIEVGEHDGRLYVVLHWPAGTPLRDLPPTPWPPERALAVVQRLAEALDVAHDRRIVHGDLTPASTIVAEDGTATLVGLGLLAAAEQSGHAADLPRDPDWTTPEQRAEAPSEPASDRYALGRLATLLLTGQSVLRGNPAAGGAASSAAWAVLARQASSSATERYPTAAAFADALAGALDGALATSSGTSPPAALLDASSPGTGAPLEPSTFTRSPLSPSPIGTSPTISPETPASPVPPSAASAVSPSEIPAAVPAFSQPAAFTPGPALEEAPSIPLTNWPATRARESAPANVMATPSPAEATVRPEVAGGLTSPGICSTGTESASSAVAIPSTADAAGLDAAGLATGRSRPATRWTSLSMDWAPPAVWPPLPDRLGASLKPAERMRFIRRHALVGAVAVTLLGLSCTAGKAPSASSLIVVLLFGTIMYAGGGAILGALVGYLRLAAAEAGTSTSTMAGEQVATVFAALAQERTSERATRDLLAVPPVRSNGTAYLWQDRDGDWWMKAPNGSNLTLPPLAGRRMAVAAGGARDGAPFGLAGITSHRVLEAAEAVVSGDGSTLLLVLDRGGNEIYRDPRYHDST
ncbi:MAG: hypothetical protein IT305_02950 [Chloroflexi bacterium]|nr:hypothetical protein [Chloroflexota bacterium]